MKGHYNRLNFAKFRFYYLYPFSREIRCPNIAWMLKQVIIFSKKYFIYIGFFFFLFLTRVFFSFRIMNFTAFIVFDVGIDVFDFLHIEIYSRIVFVQVKIIYLSGTRHWNFITLALLRMDINVISSLSISTHYTFHCLAIVSHAAPMNELDEDFPGSIPILYGRTNLGNGPF